MPTLDDTLNTASDGYRTNRSALQAQIDQHDAELLLEAGDGALVDPLRAHVGPLFDGDLGDPDGGAGTLGVT